jgi:formiminoglutamase
MATPLPIAIVSPHGSLTIPPELKDLSQLTPAQIFNEADAYIDDIFDFGDKVSKTVRFPYARALLDVNRALDSTLNRPGDGIIKAQTSYGEPVYTADKFPNADLCRHLINKYWHTWHQQLETIVNDPTIKLVIDAHSMAATGPDTYDDPDLRRPRFMVGNMGGENGVALAPDFPVTAPPHMAQQLSHLLAGVAAKLPALTTTGQLCCINYPFRGGWNLRRHGGIRQPWLMIEVSRALYIGEQTGDSDIMPANQAIIQNLRDTLWGVIETFVSTVEL